MSVTPGQTVLLGIEKPAAGGRMIARLDREIVLVSGAIPGERVRARIERVAKGVAYAETIAVEERSPDRRDEFDDPLCGGCIYGHIAYARQLTIKADVIADAFARIARLPLGAPVPVAPSHEEGYRMRARLHVRGRTAGFFREGTHDVCDPRPTRQLLPETCDALDRLVAAAHAAGLYTLGEIELSENVDASERVAFLDTVLPIDWNTLHTLATTPGFTGIVTPAGAIGNDHVMDRLVISGASTALRRHVLAFFQGNRHLLADFAARVIAHVNGSDVLDLYAGVGLFSVAVAARGGRVTAVEGDRFAVSDLTANAAMTGGSVAAVHQPVEQFVRARSAPRVPTIIVDPPRTGLSREALDGVVDLEPSRVIYVSCDVATLARDARHIVDAGYRIESVEGFDLFPNTPHVETVVVFTSNSRTAPAGR
jgi:23S rRNA (uracil1939-C5)-methyltransferase